MDHDKFPQSLTTLANACSDQARNSNRLWVFAATLTLIVATGRATEGSVKALGFDIDVVYFFPVFALLLAAVNIAYCSLQLQTAFTYRIYAALIKKIVEEEKSKEPKSTQEHGKKTVFFAGFPFQHVAHALYTQTHNRMYPFTRMVEEKENIEQSKVYKLLKVQIDLLFYLTPIFGCLLSLWRASRNGWTAGIDSLLSAHPLCVVVLWMVGEFLFFWIVVLSAVASGVLWLTARQYIRDAAKDIEQRNAEDNSPIIS